MIKVHLPKPTPENKMARKSIFPLVEATFFTNVLVSLPTISLAGLCTIPEDASQVHGWFNHIIEPFSVRKGTLHQALVTAECTNKVIRVGKDGSGDFNTVTAALKSIKAGNAQRTVISIGPGHYVEKIRIDRDKPFITFLGDPSNMPTIEFDATASQYGTVDSATLIVESHYFVASNIIVANTAPRPDGKRKGAQAVALRISGEYAAFYSCRFIGFQDTVCDDKGKHFFNNCYIEGTVDFIFGDGRSIYLNTELHVISGDPIDVITAQAGKQVEDVGGYSFVHCSVTGTGHNTFLGRAWMPAAEAVFAYCTFSDAVRSEGWSDYFRPEVQKSVIFGEYKCKGPGAITNGRVKYAKMLTDAQVQPYISLDYIEADKWLLPPPRI